MSKTSVILFWAMWLLDVLLALYGHREFINGVFGRYAAPTRTYLMYWTALLGGGLLLICGSLWLKNSGHLLSAMMLAGAPLVLGLPYLLWLAAIVLFGSKNNWR